jgi:hypothetical protein
MIKELSGHVNVWTVQHAAHTALPTSPSSHLSPNTNAPSMCLKLPCTGAEICNPFPFSDFTHAPSPRLGLLTTFSKALMVESRQLFLSVPLVSQLV